MSSNTNDLQEIYERIAYAESEVPDIEQAVSDYLNANTELRTRKGITGTVVSVRREKPLPIALRSKIGIVINEIRSSLDELACRLAVRNGKTMRDVHFPISKDRAAYLKDAPRKIGKLSIADQHALNGLGLNGEDRPFLFGMHDVDRVRKHQRSFVGQIATAGLEMLGPGDFYGMSYVGPVAVDENWRPVIVAHFLNTVEIKVGLAATFAEPSQLEGINVTAGILRFASEAKDIVRLFDPQPQPVSAG